MVKRIHAFISGRVQGVGFRATTRRTARKLGVKGWVRNLPDGRVETVAEGDQELIEKFLKFLYKGSAMARVEDVEVEEKEPKNEFEAFRIRY